MEIMVSQVDRRGLLEQCFQARMRLFELSAALEEAEDELENSVAEELAGAQRTLAGLIERYEAGLAAVPLSRCPFTGELLSYVIDTGGLDGLWWDYEAPARPAGKLPPTFFALDGALTLGEPLETFPHLCRPGPEAPFVVPRLLQRPEISAVVSGLAVGPHIGYAITYFAQPVPMDVPRLNEWGSSEYWVTGESGTLGWDSVEEDPAAYDYDLEPWIRAGKLLWIAPGDERMMLLSDVRRCPYLGLPGRRYPLFITAGEVLEPVAASDPTEPTEPTEPVAAGE
jgi:hypothetical protein